MDEGEDIENNKKVSSKGKEDGDESDGYDDPEEEEEEEDEDDYPEGATEYDPPDSLHSCTDITMTDRLLDRLKVQAHAGVVEYFCRKKVLTQKKTTFPHRANTASKACTRLRDEIGEEKKLYNRLR